MPKIVMTPPELMVCFSFILLTLGLRRSLISDFLRGPACESYKFAMFILKANRVPMGFTDPLGRRMWSEVWCQRLVGIIALGARAFSHSSS